MSMAAINERAVIGGNAPPGPIEAGMDTAVALSAWLAEHPVIETEDHAKDAKLLLDRAKSSAGEVEDARKKETKPLNDELDEINRRYKAIHNADAKKPGVLDLTTRELKARVTDWLARQEAIRLLALREAEKAAAELADKAAAAVAAKDEAIENARAGELGIDVTQEVVKAGGAILAAERAGRVVQRAERDADNTKLAGGWRNSIGLKNKETLVLVSYGKAITAIGPHPKIEAAVLSAAREYRSERGELPEGVTSEITRSI